MASLTVSSPVSATAVVNVFAAAATGARTIALTTGPEIDTLSNGFTVTAGAPVLLSATPSSGQQGQSSLSITLAGQFTNWVQGTTTANFGAGITVVSLNVTSPTAATAVLNITSAAATGTRTITLATGSEIDTLSNGFTVTPGSPVLLSATPNNGQVGQQNLSVALAGQFTNWVQGTTTANFGTGITVVSLTVSSATSATAILNIDPAAATGARTITLTTGAEVDTLSSGLTVEAAAIPIITAISPKSALGIPTATLTVSGSNLTGSTFAFSPSTNISISASTIAPGGASATLTLNIAAAATGRFTLIGTNGAGVSDPTVRLGFVESFRGFQYPHGSWG